MSEIFAPGSIAGPPATFMGAYKQGTSYSIGAAVSSGGSSYVSLIVGNIGHDPGVSPTQWAMLAAGGSPGTNGTAGQAGTPGTNGQVTNAALVAAVGMMSRTADGSVNQLNPANGFQGLLNWDGSLLGFGAYNTSGFITATGSLMLTNFNMIGNDRPVCCYDLTQTFIGHGTLVGGAALPDPTVAGTIIQLLPGTAYVKGTASTASLAAPSMVVFGDATYPPVMPGSYQSFTYYPSNVVDANIATAVAGVGTVAGPQIAACLPSGRNLYDVSLQSQNILVPGGLLSPSASYVSTTGFILVAGLSALYCNAVVANMSAYGSVAFYDANKQFLSFAGGEVLLHAGDVNGFLPNTAITVPAGAVYARLTTAFGAGSGGLSPLYVVPAATMVMASATPGTYEPFGYDLPTAVDAKIAAAVAVANAAIQAQFVALGGGLGVVHENRPAQVAIVEGQNLAAGASKTLFSATGPGSVERIQLAFVNTSPSASKLTELEACTLTINVDGNIFTTTVGMFFLSIGISDANPANEVFSTKWLERSISNQEGQQGLGRRIYIPYQTSCSIVFNTVNTCTVDIYTQVEFYKGAPLPGLHSLNRRVFHMATTEWRDSVGLTPYQQIKMLPTAVIGPGILEHWHVAGSCNATGIGNAPGWLEANPTVSFDGTSFGAGGTEDFFGTQYYGTDLQPKADEFSFSLFTSGKTGLTYTLLARHFDQFPLPFTTSLGPVTWANGQGGQGITPLPSMKCGMQIVWYTAT